MKIEMVENLKKRMDETNKYVRDALDGKRKWDPKKAERTIILTPETFAQVFTPQRMRLLLRVKRNKINNIYQLAKELGRPYEAVHRDVKYLEGFGLIKIKKRERERIPFMDERIEMPVLSAT